MNEKIITIARANACEKLSQTKQCSMCQALPQVESFRAACKRSHTANMKTSSETTGKERNDTMTKPQLVKKLRVTTANLRKAERTIARKNRVTKRDIELAGNQTFTIEHSNRLAADPHPSSLTALVAGLDKISREGLKGTKQTAFDFASDILRNMMKTTNYAKRYSKGTKTLLSCIRDTGTRRLYETLASTLGLASERAARTWMYAVPVFELGLSEKNFHNAGIVMATIMEHRQLKPGSILCAVLEDETAVIAKPMVNLRRNEVEGYCGPDCQNKCPTIDACRKSGTCPVVHQCQWNKVNGDPIQPEPAAYQSMVKVHKEMRVGNLARAMVLRPMHPLLATIPVLLIPTCKAFTTNDYIRNNGTRSTCGIANTFSTS